MNKYFRVYKSLLIFNWNALIVYRIDFFTRLLTSILYTAYHVLAIFILTNTVSSVFGWSRYELLLLASSYSIFIGLFHAFISRNIHRLSEEIYYGRLDYLLVKPIDSQFSATLWTVDFISFFRIGIGMLLSWYFVSVLHLTITVLTITLYVAAMVMGLSILYSIWLSVISLTIFNPRLSNLIDLLYHISELTRYPRDMYQHLSLFIFSMIFPFTLVLIPSTKILLHTFGLFQLSETVGMSVVLFLVSRFIWMHSLKYYASASS